MSLFALPSTFCATKTTQTWADLAAWEEFLQSYDVQTLIELGTECGGMSTFLLCQSLARGIIFETWDIENQPTLFQKPDGSRVTMTYNADHRRVRKET